MTTPFNAEFVVLRAVMDGDNTRAKELLKQFSRSELERFSVYAETLSRLTWYMTQRRRTVRNANGCDVNRCRSPFGAHASTCDVRRTT